MLKKIFYEIFRKNKVFKVGDSFLFAVQIPDDSVGCSGSRCSNCNSEVAHCDQICRQCKLPFIGPFGFPQLPDWEPLTLDEKRTIIKKIYRYGINRGRLKYAGAEFVPLTSDELDKVEKLKSDDAESFFWAHNVTPQKIRESLLI